MYRILIVDDDVPIREWIAWCIERNFSNQLSVVCAANAAEAAARFSETHFDILITDIVMPHMDGLTLLQQLQDIRSDFFSIVLTSHTSFEYVRTAMKLNSSDYILKQEMDEPHLVEIINRYLDRLESQRNQIARQLNRDSYLANLISGVSSSPNPADLNKLGIKLQEAPILSFLIFRKHHAPTHFVLPTYSGEDARLFNVNSYAHADNYSIIFCNVELGKHSVYNMLREVMLLNSDCCILEGAIAPNPTGLGAILSAADKIAPLGFYLPLRYIPQDYQQQIQAARVKSTKNLKQFQRDFSTVGYTDFPKLFSALISFAIHTCPPDMQEFRQVCITAVRHLCLLVPLLSFSLEDLKTEILRAYSLEEIQRIVQPLLSSVLPEHSSKTISPHIVQALAYLQNNYSSISGMNEVAEYVHISPEYFSRLFRNETGKTFISYLNEYRLKRAKQLFDTTDMKVNQVAEQVGYASLSYFSRLFKDYYGENPFLYRSNAGTSEH